MAKVPEWVPGALIDLKGKKYLQVQDRVRWFREVYPLGRIKTERISLEENQITYKSEVMVPSVKPVTDVHAPMHYLEVVNYTILANAEKTQTIKSTLDYEKCETGAIGRALALAGFGTQFATEDLNEGDVVDAPREKYGVTGLSNRVDQEYTSAAQPHSVLPTRGGTTLSTPDELEKFLQGDDFPFGANKSDDGPNYEANGRNETRPSEQPGATKINGSLTLHIGKFTGKTLAEALAQDSLPSGRYSKKYSYLEWVLSLLAKGQSDVHPDLITYADYAKQQGVTC